ncbi:MAG: calcium/sodium antiporter [Nitratireductor sp.]|nr:calcium/sodium antiporter [Nitratireductor sp.]
MTDYLLLLAGLAVLMVGGDVLVRGAVGLAERLNIPHLVIGLTIVAFGTSAPELFISVQAALANASGIALGNVVGSNIANVLLVMGLPALIAPSRCEGEGIGRNIVVMIGFTLVFMAMMLDGAIGRIDGAILLAMLLLFITDQYRTAMGSATPGAEPEAAGMSEDVCTVPHSTLVIIAMLAFGLAALPLGADLTVDAATAIARRWNVSDDVIGLTIVAVGTSLPELATALIAVLRGSHSIAIGNVVGSNIFNIGSIMGIAPLIAPIAVGGRFVQQDMWIMLACALVLAALAFWNIKIGKRVGFAMVGAYGMYAALAFLF